MKNNLKKCYRNKEFILLLKRNYTNGRLISDEQWQQVIDMADIIDKIEIKSDYLRTQKTIQSFLGSDVESFQILSQNYTLLLKTLLNIEDCINYEDNEEIFSSKEELTEIIEKVFEDIETIKKNHTEYLTQKL